MISLHTNNKGVTLIEMLIAMSVATMLIAGIYTVYIMQLKTHETQNQIVQMQQNLRATMYVIERDLRHAGLDPHRSGIPGITGALAGDMTFTMDITGGESDTIDNDLDGTIDEDDEARFSDGKVDEATETYRYALRVDGQGNQYLGRLIGIESGTNSFKVLCDHVDAVNFLYLDGNGDIVNMGAGSISSVLNSIRSVQVTIVVRSGRVIKPLFDKIVDNQTYRNKRGQIVLSPRNDNFRRMSLTSEIKLRNLHG